MRLSYQLDTLGVRPLASEDTTELHALIEVNREHLARWLPWAADQTIEAEITGLAEQYQRLGLSGLAQSVTNRALHGEQGIYLLADQAHRPIAGLSQTSR